MNNHYWLFNQMQLDAALKEYEATAGAGASTLVRDFLNSPAAETNMLIVHIKLPDPGGAV